MKNPWLKFAAVFAIILTVWTVGGFLLHRFVVQQNNATQLEETAQDLMRRAEKAVDFAVIAATELLVSGQTQCSPETRSVLRRLVVATGNSTDVFLVTSSGSCSGIDDLGITLPSEDERAGWSVARNAKYRIGKIDLGHTMLIGVSWGLGTDLEVVSVMNPDAFLFDALPNDLRNQGRIDLFLGDAIAASFLGDATRTLQSGNWAVFEAIGDRYPIGITMRIDTGDLAKWHAAISPGAILAWTAFGIIAACGAAATAIRNYNHALADVIRALKDKEISAYFQPIVDIESNRVIGCEALARWTKRSGETIPPGRFIPLIEDFDLNDDLLSIMVEQAARGLGGAFEQDASFYVSFNATPVQLSRPDFTDFMIELAHKNTIAPSQMCIEITERQIIASPDATAKTTAKLTAAGFRVAIDDAGTGHNGLAAIQQLDVDTIKIDKFFVDHIDDDPRSRVMVDMFVSVAARYGMKTVAEGVETAQQLNALRAARVRAMQGFLHSKPLPAEQFMIALTTTWKEDGQPNRSRQDPTAEAPANASDPEAETARLEALYRYQIIDSDDEEAFDRITRIAKDALGVKMTAIALIDQDRHWFKSIAGATRADLARRHDLCTQTVLDPEPTIVPDTFDDPLFRDDMQAQDAPDIRAYLGVPVQTSDGHRIGAVCCMDPQPRGFEDHEVALIKDLAAITMEQIEMRACAFFDALTTARARRSFWAEAETNLKLAHLQSRPFCALMLDIDHFKQINDAFGHKVGDEVLRGLGQRLNALLGENHVFGRMGGEEFAIAASGTDLSQMTALGEMLCAAIQDTAFQTSRGPILVTVSIGTAAADKMTLDLDDLIEQANWALYQAKDRGRNRVVAAPPRAA
ncbi:MAG: EAL domain-containing protein [Pseudomonadota bacterium]